MCRASKEQRTARYKSDFPETTRQTDEQSLPATYRTSLAVAVKTSPNHPWQKKLNMRFEIVAGVPNKSQHENHQVIPVTTHNEEEWLSKLS
jgi:hypothetical protein